MAQFGVFERTNNTTFIMLNCFTTPKAALDYAEKAQQCTPNRLEVFDMTPTKGE